MLNKLALRNARRSARDYLVYLVTMTIIASLMFAFNAMIFSRDIIRLFQVAGIMAAMIGIATFFILLIVAWLVHYMVNFMLENRSREFGTYMLMGMKQKQIARMFLRENMLLGLMAFILGILPGVFLQRPSSTARGFCSSRQGPMKASRRHSNPSGSKEEVMNWWARS